MIEQYSPHDDFTRSGRTGQETGHHLRIFLKFELLEGQKNVI